MIFVIVGVMIVCILIVLDTIYFLKQMDEDHNE